MSNEHLPDEFDWFVQECERAADPPPTLAELAARNRIPTPAELLARANRERERQSEADPFARLIQAEQAVTQQRMAHEMRRPTEIRKAATPPTFDNEATPEPGDLSWALGESEVGDNEPPVIAATSRLPDHGRVGGPSFAKVGGGSESSFLNKPLPAVFEAIAERCSARAAEFARSLSEQARELEVL